MAACQQNGRTARDAAASRGDGAFIDGDRLGWLNDRFENVPRGGAVSLTVTRRQRTPAENELVYCPQDVMLGVGCARGCQPDELIDLVMQELSRADINAAAIAGVFSVDLKADEPALEALASMLDVLLRIFDRETLARETPRLANPSTVVESEIGTLGVAEAAALAASGPEAALYIQRRNLPMQPWRWFLRVGFVTTLLGGSPAG